MKSRFRFACAIPVLGLLAPLPAAAVSVTTGTVGGLVADIWTWTDAAGHPRTVALKKEGNGNPGHGGYAIQFTNVAGTKITINADNSAGDGGFGYFVSHERYRSFADGKVDTIASHIFGKDDSPLGLGFAATTAMPATPAGTGAERFTIAYGHYGTIVPHTVNDNTGTDAVPLPEGQANYAFYTTPATTTWVFKDGTNYPRIDIAVDLSGVIPPGGSTPLADLVSFDMRGPYGVMIFDNDVNATVNSVFWGDQQYLFTLSNTPVTRDSGWAWNTLNHGARYQALQAGAFEMGLFEPVNVRSSASVDDYDTERGNTNVSYANNGGKSFSSCPSGKQQVLPSDGSWPYQSVQYSLSCVASQFNTPTRFKKLAWGTTAYFGTSLTSVYNGQKTYAFDGFPSSHQLDYSVCLVLGKFPAGKSLTANVARTFVRATPLANCPLAAVP